MPPHRDSLPPNSAPPRATVSSRPLPETPPRRALPLLALIALACGFSLVGSLLLLPFFPSLHASFSRVFRFAGAFPSLDLGLPTALATLVLTPLALVGAALRQPLRTPRGRVFFGLTVLAALVVNLVFLVLFPSVPASLADLLDPSFRATHGPALLLLALTLVVACLVARRLPFRTPRDFVQLGLVLTALLTADLIAAALSPSLLDSFQTMSRRFLPTDPADRRAAGALALGATLFALPALVAPFVAWRLRLSSWRWLGAAALVLAPVLVYLATDDTVLRRPLTMEEIAPPFSGAEKSFAVLMRYGKNHPLGQSFRAPDRIHRNLVAGEAIDPAKPAQWLAFLQSHRAAIEADWADLAPIRAWWTELNAFDRIGDLTPSHYDAEIMTFAPPRTFTQHACAIASLQALDGHGDAAIDTLIPVIQVGRKLQPSGRTLVRLMLSIVIERTGLHTAHFILQHAAVSPAARARLAAVLSASGGGESGARRLATIEYVFSLQVLADKPVGELLAHGNPTWLRNAFNLAGPFVYNPRATLNLYGDLVADLQEFVAHRHLDRLEPRAESFFAHEGRPRFKNFIGVLLLHEVVPGFAKIGETYWQVQDLRAALLTRLAAP